MDRSKKLSVALLLVPIAIFALFTFRVYESYGSFTNIPHHDLTMWIFMLLFGLVFALMFLAALIFIVTLQDESVETEEDGSYIESFEFEEPVEAPEPVIEKEIIEEEAPAELQVEAPELNEMVAEETAEVPVESPPEWAEEEFE